MLLLDNNVQIALIQYFKSIKIDCSHASELGWHELENGKLVSKAAENGFTAIITNDKRFSETGRVALKKLPSFSIVVLRIPQTTVNIYNTEI